MYSYSVQNLRKSKIQIKVEEVLLQLLQNLEKGRPYNYFGILPKILRSTDIMYKTYQK